MSDNTERTLNAGEQAEIRIQYMGIQLIQAQIREVNLQHQNAQMAMELTQRRAQELQEALKQSSVKLTELQNSINEKYNIKPDERVDDDGRIVPRTTP